MTLGIKFCPPEHYLGGSQHTQAFNLIKAIHAVHQQVVVFSSFRWFSEIGGLTVEPIDNPLAHRDLLTKALTYLHEQLTFKQRLRLRDCQVLLCPFNSEGLLCTGRVPQVLIVRDLIPLVFPKHFPRTFQMWRFIYARAIRGASAIITVSEHTRSDLLRILKVPAERVWVVPNGFNPVAKQRVAASPDGLDKFILYVSSSHYPYKNIARLIEAYHRLRHDFDHKLVIVGQPVPRFSCSIYKTIRSLELSDSVKLLCNLSNQELASLYQHAGLFVYPTLYEGFGMPPLEAMSCGVPVVASNRTAVPEVCGEAAHYVDPCDVGSLLEGMAEVLSNSRLRSSLIERGLERVTHFDWLKSADSIVRICKWAATTSAA